MVANLLRNAIDAIAGLNGRTRVLTASSTVTDGHASIKTADTGAGIDCAGTERVFDALYTTKNEGLGLGMSICRDIIAAHGGRPMGGQEHDARRDATRPVVREQLRMSSSVFVHVVDDDMAVRESLGDLLRSVNYQVKLYGSASEFLKVELPDAPACLVLDVRLPGTSGLELQEYLARINIPLPVILMTGFGDIPMSVRGMKKGAVDFLTKPIRHQDLLDAVAAAIRMDQDRRLEIAQVAQLRAKYALLTPRERQVMALVASGLMNKQVANELSISEVTVKMHRGSIMRKFGARSVAILVRIAEALDIER